RGFRVAAGVACAIVALVGSCAIVALDGSCAPGTGVSADTAPAAAAAASERFLGCSPAGDVGVESLVSGTGAAVFSSGAGPAGPGVPMGPPEPGSGDEAVPAAGVGAPAALSSASGSAGLAGA